MTQRLNKVVYCSLIDKSQWEVMTTENSYAGDSCILFTVKGGSLTYDFDTDTKVSGVIDIGIGGAGEGDSIINTIIGSYIRLYTTRPGGTGKKLLCTMLPSVKDVSNTEGIVYEGSVELKSPLCAFTETQIRKTTLKKGANIYKTFLKYVKNYGCAGLNEKIAKNIDTDKKKLKFSRNKVFQTGSTPYDVMKYMASKMNAYITVTPSGLVYLKSKSSLQSRHVFSDCDIDDEFTITSPIQVTDNGKYINRCIAYFEKTEGKNVTRYYSRPVVLSSNSLHSRQNIGRNITVLKKYDEEDLKNANAKLTNPVSIRNKLTVLAKQELRAQAERNYSYTWSAPYIDELDMNDIAILDIGLDTYKVAVKSFDIDLFNGCEMTITGTSSQKPKIAYDRQTKKL